MYEDINFLTRVNVFTHEIPAALKALRPWLKAHPRLQDARLWDGCHDPFHEGEIEIDPMTPQEREAFIQRMVGV